jgi:hypothetical protein
MAHKKKVKKGKTSERKTAKKGKSRRSHEPKKQTAKRKTRDSVRQVAKSKQGSRKSSKAPGGHRGKEAYSYRYIPEWIRARSERSKAAWRIRWDRGTAPIGRVGQKYIQDTYGPTITPSDFGPAGGSSGGGLAPTDFGGGGSSIVPAGKQSAPGRDRYQDEIEDDFEDYYDDFDFYDREY